MNPDFGTNAQGYKVKRVKYEGTSTIRIGMPVCYNWDTTTNVLGLNKADNTRGTTTADGYQNEGKFKLVENAGAANGRFFAGLVHDAKLLNQAGPGWVDIVVPNGAIVPAYTDRSITAGDPAYLESGQTTLINVATENQPQVGWFVETIDRSGTAGLCLVKLLQPEMAEYEASSTLGVGLSPALWNDAPTGDNLQGINYFDDFMGPFDATNDTAGWSIDLVDTKGSVAVEDGAPGGVLAFTSATGDSADDGITGQLENCCVKPAAGINVWFEARIKVSEADEQWAIGLAAVDATIIASGIFDDASDKVLFGHHTGTADKINTITARTTADDETADVADMTDDTWVTVGFKITGITTVDFYVDGVLVESGAVTANVPNAAMVLTAVAQYEAADTILSIDWVKMVTDGGRDA